MKVYDKKFLIYGNYMIRSFGPPGLMPIIDNDRSICINLARQD